MRATKRRVGGYDPQPKNQINSFNNRSTLCNLCEVSQVDRNYSPKREPVLLTGSLSVFATNARGGVRW
jgi:hypothetical protein